MVYLDVTFRIKNSVGIVDGRLGSKRCVSTLVKYNPSSKFPST